jgi:hypothetical protein
MESTTTSLKAVPKEAPMRVREAEVAPPTTCETNAIRGIERASVRARGKWANGKQVRKVNAWGVCASTSGGVEWQRQACYLTLSLTSAIAAQHTAPSSPLRTR